MRRSTALVVCLTLALGGCGNVVAEAPSPSATVEEGAVADPHYFFSGQQIKDEFLAIETRMAQCMREEGWEYVAEDLATYFEPTEDSLEVRQQQGYGMVTSYEEATEGVELQTGDPSPNRQIYLNLTESQRAAYDESKRSCEKEAIEWLGERKREYAQKLPKEALDILVAIETGDHPDLRPAELDWVDCMSRRGWEAGSRGEFIPSIEQEVSALLEGGDKDTVKELEIQAAVD